MFLQYTRMLFKALKLYHRDTKLTAAELRAQTPMIGRLRYEDSQYAGRDGRGPRKALLMPPDPNSTTPLCELHSAKVKIDDKGVRIRREEDEWRRKNPTTYQQVLWCVPLADGEPKPPPRDPYEVEDERASIRSATYPSYATAGKRARA